MNVFKELYKYREFLNTSVKKEIRGKYKGSALGVLWSFINPLLTCLVYAIVFPYLMRVQQDYYLQYLIAGIIPWTFFTTVVQQGILTVRVNAGILKKVYFPREILPISVAVSAMINFLISCVIIFAFVIFGGMGISWHIVLLPVVAIFQMLFSLGLIFVLSAVNIYIKDTEYIVNFVIQMLFYGTPIIYPISLLDGAPVFLSTLVQLNPMTQFIQFYRDIFYYQQMPNLVIFGCIAFMSIIVLVIGYKVFKKLEKGFAEEV